MRLSVALLAAVLCISCATIGKDFDSESIDKVTVGEASREKVVALFGEPFSKTEVTPTSQNKFAVLSYMYQFAKGNLVSGARAKAFAVSFVERDIAVDKAYSVSGEFAE